MPATPRLTLKREPPMRHCFNCGAQLGHYRDYDPLDNCGQTDCQREAHAAAREDRFEAHAQLDRDMGWGRF